MKKIVLAGLIALALSAGAFAQTAQPAQSAYALIAAGSSRFGVDCAGTTSCDKTDTGWKVFGGYRFTPNWAAEVGYFDFGKAKATLNDAQLGVVSAAVESTAIGLGVAFHQDLAADWPCVARLGVASVKTRVSASVTGASGNDSDRSANGYVGLGIGYRLSRIVSADLAWDYTRSKYNKNGLDASGNVNMVSLGLTVGF